jgi:hypothetical protein
MQLQNMNEILLKFSSAIMPKISSENDACREYIEKQYQEIKEEYRFDLYSAVMKNRIKLGHLGYEKGLNTFGVLLDRLTILNAKLMFLGINDQSNKQISGVLETIQSCKPAATVILAKETGDRLIEIDQNPFATLLLLQKSNIAQWVNQDLLYTADPERASYDRLKSYVIETRYDNTLRNKAIEKLDFWYSNFRIDGV